MITEEKNVKRKTKRKPTWVFVLQKYGRFYSASLPKSFYRSITLLFMKSDVLSVSANHFRIYF